MRARLVAAVVGGMFCGVLGVAAFSASPAGAGGLPDTASVRVTKHVTGPTPWEFEMNISPVPSGQPAKQTVTWNNPTVVWTNLVAGTTYTVTETANPGYDAGPMTCIGATRDATADATFTPSSNDLVVCTIENTLAELPATGTDSGVLTLLALGLLAVGSTVTLANRRRRVAR